MRILVTGAKGFIGRNLIAELRNRGYEDIFEYDRESTREDLLKYTAECDFVFHLAGINRPKDPKEFLEGNFGFSGELLECLKSAGNKAPVLVTSSIQAELDNPYGESKRKCEELLFSHGSIVYVYRLPNVFGKWCRPNYNSGVATFCHNIAHELPIQVNDPSVIMRLVYIDDVVEEFINALEGNATALADTKVYGSKAEGRYDIAAAGDVPAICPQNSENYKGVPVVHEITLGKIAELIYSFKESREKLSIPDMSDAFTSKLYSTYLSYLPEDKFSYCLNMNTDNRGSFTEFIRNEDRGQVSVNISKPGITKGQHWHHSKNEKFLVVKGKGVIRFRRIDSDEIIEYPVSGDKLEVVDIPTGYTHSIVNVGDEDMVTVMWANEPFNPEKPDTYFLPV